MARKRRKIVSDDSGAQDRTAYAPSLIPGVLITFKPGMTKAAVEGLRSAAGISSVAFAADFADQAVDPEQTLDAGMTVFDSLGVAVADVDPDQESSLAAAMSGGDTAVDTVEPEPIFFATADGSPHLAAYLRGYRDAVSHLHDSLVGAAALPGLESVAAIDAFQDTDQATWGLVATETLKAQQSGRGVRVAILDTGLDLDHPDFRGRQVVSRSFIPGQAVQDDNGHGTHCAGTACGASNPVRGRRYGVAHQTEIYIGKVLSNQGSSLGRSTLAGIEWAVSNGCHVISMSLSGRVSPGQRFLNAFETPAREAMRRGTLIIAAAGNDSNRAQNDVEPVGSPANCPSIMAVAAVDRFLRTANFSNGAINPDGRIDIAGPGVNVYSSAPEPAAPAAATFFPGVVVTV
jgi:subtilisin